MTGWFGGIGEAIGNFAGGATEPWRNFAFKMALLAALTILAIKVMA